MWPFGKKQPAQKTDEELVAESVRDRQQKKEAAQAESGSMALAQSEATASGDADNQIWPFGKKQPAQKTDEERV